MVDCGNARCAQDRRVLKKELLTWTKKVPMLVGVEVIAEELLGKDVFQKLMEPYNNLEVELGDWEPQSTCHFCESRAKTKTETVVSQENVSEDNGCEVDSTNHTYLQHLLPMAYSPNTLPDMNSLEEEAPLDLSASSAKSSKIEDDLNKTGVELKVPQIQTKIGKKKEPGAKKNYTTDELAAAVSDIRSGKLGTRRAAALYGIPRSTLRNKIFRMESENHNDFGYHDNKLAMSDLLQNMANSEMCGNYMMNGKSENFNMDGWERKLAQMRRKHDLNAGLERPFGMPPLFYNSHHMLECEKAFSLSNPYAYELKLPFLHELVRKFAEQRMDMERHLHVPADLSVPKGLSHNGMESLQSQQNVELKIPSYKPMRNYTNGVTPGSAGDSPPTSSASHSNLSRINDTLKDVIAKSIAEKMRSRAQLSNGSSYSQSPLHSSSMPYFNGTPMTEGHSSEDSQSSEPSPKKKKLEMSREQPESISSTTSSDGEKKPQSGEQNSAKKTRPKRGQYRKYNSQLLLEAVRAVQRGEMSVHRAGSYFGVPHSTLEYKVKERHLLRQKKSRENGKKPTESSSVSTVSSSNASGSKEETEHLGTPAEKPDKPKKQAKTTESPKRVSKAASSGISKSLSGQCTLPPSYPIGAGPLPMGFGWPPAMGSTGMPLGMPDPSLAAYMPSFCGINMSASDLLKKLQRKVQAKAYNEGSDADGDEEESSLASTSKSQVSVK